MHARGSSVRSWASKLRKAARLATRRRWREALWKGVAATTEHAELPLPTNAKTVIDAGANRGQFAVFARERWPQAIILCFEPLRAPRAKLEAVTRDDPHVKVYSCALGAVDDKLAMHVSGQDDSSSLLRPTSLQTEMYPATSPTGEEIVTICKLDNVLTDPLDRPIVLKIDVQGYELDVLRGATKTLDQVENVLIEVSYARFYAGQPLATDIHEFLLARGFSLVAERASATSRDGAVLQSDRLYRRGTHL